MGSRGLVFSATTRAAVTPGAARETGLERRGEPGDPSWHRKAEMTSVASGFPATPYFERELVKRLEERRRVPATARARSQTAPCGGSGGQLRQSAGGSVSLFPDLPAPLMLF